VDEIPCERWKDKEWRDLFAVDVDGDSDMPLVAQGCFVYLR